MGVMFPLLAGCRFMFTAVIMVDITVVKHSVCVQEGKLSWHYGGIQPFVLLLSMLYAIVASAD